MSKRAIRASVALGLLSLTPVLGAQAEARKLRQLEQRIAEERRSWLEFRARATTDAERAELAAAFPRDEFVAELEAVARATKDGEVAAEAWIECLRIGALLDDRALYGRALERLVTDHVASGTMAGLTLELVYGAPAWSARPAAAALRTILAKNTDASVQANGLAELALLVGLDDSFGAVGRAEAETLLARIEKEFGDQDFIGMSGREFAAGARFEMGRLRVGMVAPDFEVTDQHGQRFKLSDYRGRVVLLDFWGFV